MSTAKKRQMYRKPRRVRGVAGRVGVTVIPGTGAAHRGSYAVVKKGDVGIGTLNRVQMRQLRDALTAALGESSWPWLGPRGEWEV